MIREFIEKIITKRRVFKRVEENISIEDFEASLVGRSINKEKCL